MNALFIGRFQPFHKGHFLVLQQLSTQYDKVIIGIGSSQYHDTAENPFSEIERTDMINQSLHDAGIDNFQIVGIPDIHNPPAWVDHVCSLISDFDVVITNNPVTKALFSEKGFIVKETTFFNKKKYSGKEIRRRILHHEPWDKLVPEAVVHIIHDVNGLSRLQNISF
ncbi:MAG: nicotinamide-nucleotide adenylyltransferase [Candidatus Thermoplasmatota archaeon]|nr:nicotinamide-nucleotide adenylyltransferase [Candidatus Thermoplasmatota archaeon]